MDRILSGILARGSPLAADTRSASRSQEWVASYNDNKVYLKGDEGQTLSSGRQTIEAFDAGETKSFSYSFNPYNGLSFDGGTAQGTVAVQLFAGDELDDDDVNDNKDTVDVVIKDPDNDGGEEGGDEGGDDVTTEEDSNPLFNIPVVGPVIEFGSDMLGALMAMLTGMMDWFGGLFA